MTTVNPNTQQHGVRAGFITSAPKISAADQKTLSTLQGHDEQATQFATEAISSAKAGTAAGKQTAITDLQTALQHYSMAMMTGKGLKGSAAQEAMQNENAALKAINQAKQALGDTKASQTTIVNRDRAEVQTLEKNGQLDTTQGQTDLAKLGIWGNQYKNIVAQYKKSLQGPVLNGQRIPVVPGGSGLTKQQLDKDIDSSNVGSNLDGEQSAAERRDIAAVLKADGGTLSSSDVSTLEKDGVTQAQIKHLQADVKKAAGKALTQGDINHVVTSHNVGIDKIARTKPLSKPKPDGGAGLAPGKKKPTTKPKTKPNGGAAVGSGKTKPTTPKSKPAPTTKHTITTYNRTLTTKTTGLSAADVTKLKAAKGYWNGKGEFVFANPVTFKGKGGATMTITGLNEKGQWQGSGQTGFA